MPSALLSTDAYGAAKLLPQSRVVSERESMVVRDILQEFSQMTVWRNNFAMQWEEVASLIDPTQKNTFFYGNFTMQGEKRTQQQVDASGMMALSRFAAICDSMLTPRNMEWHQLRADNDDVMKDRQTRLWFEQVTKILFKFRYSPLANFTGQNQNVFRALGAYGNCSMFIDKLDARLHPGSRGWRYKAIPTGEMFFRESHQGIVDGFVRWFKLTAYQAMQKWGMEYLPAGLHVPLQNHSQWQYSFLHCVRPRLDYDPDRYDIRALPYSSHYVSLEGQCLMAPEGGYRSFPIAPSRYDQGPNEVYGRGPAMMVLPALKTLNAQKTTFLKQGHRAADPVLLTTDDGVVDFNLRPGALNKGGMSSDGKRLVDVLPTGNIQVNEKMMEMERSLIDDAFLVSLFKLILEEKVLTATQVTEIVNQKGILIGPTLGRQQSEYLGPMIDRELDEGGSQGLLPPMPPGLREARGEYRVIYTSPLARTQRAGGAAGGLRTLDIAHTIAQSTGDPSIYDHFDFDQMMPEVADINGMPLSWMASDQQKQAKAQQRAKAQSDQQKVAAAPGQAALMNAQAHQAKAGMLQPQQQPGAPAGAPVTQ
jgi:hypothetical protein